MASVNISIGSTAGADPSFTLAVLLTDSGDKVKRRIMVEKDIPVEAQRLVYKCEEWNYIDSHGQSWAKL